MPSWRYARTAVEEMRCYLSKRYDCDRIFTRTGDERSQLVLMMAIDIAVYHIFSIHNPRNRLRLLLIRKFDFAALVSSGSRGSPSADISSAATAERSQLVLMMAIDIAVYHIFSIHNPRNLSPLRKERYERPPLSLREAGAARPRISLRPLPP